jgi:hypothetical protein
LRGACPSLVKFEIFFDIRQSELKPSLTEVTAPIIGTTSLKNIQELVGA